MRRITSFLIAGMAVMLAGCGGGGGGDNGGSNPPPPPGGFTEGHYKGNYTENAFPLSGGIPLPGGKGWLGNTKGAIDITVTSGMVTGTFTPTGGAAVTAAGTINNSGYAVITFPAIKPTAEIYGKLLSSVGNDWGSYIGESDGDPVTGHFTGGIGIEIVKQ